MIKNAGEKLLTLQRTIRLQKQNEKLSLELATLKGSLQPVEEMRADIVAANQAVKARLLGMPAKIVPQLHAAQSESEVAEILIREIHEALLDLSNPGGEEAG